jgi:hypothetical protein
MCYQVDPLVYWYSLVSIRYFAIPRTTNHDVTKVNCCISAEVRPEFFRNYFQYFFTSRFRGIPRNSVCKSPRKFMSMLHVQCTYMSMSICTSMLHVHVQNTCIGSAMEALQLHFNTPYHWSNGLTVCFLPSGAAIHVPGMHPHLRETGISF